MAHYSTPPLGAHNSFARNGNASNGYLNSTATPVSASSSNNTYLMPMSPMKGFRTMTDAYKPKIARTCGQRPACLVNASVTYCGNNSIYAFGGFDQYTDEGNSSSCQSGLYKADSAIMNLVYNHVLKLDLTSLQWSLVDNYGDIPGVRMGT